MKVMETGQRARPKFYYVDPPLFCNSGENFPRHDSEGGRVETRREWVLKVAEFPKLALIHGIPLSLPI